MEVVDLDILRPAPRMIKLGGHKIDLSFVPCGITFDIDKISRRLVEIGPRYLPLLGKIELVSVDMLYCELVRRTHKVSNKLPHVSEIGLHSERAVSADLQVAVHEISELPHDVLLIADIDCGPGHSGPWEDFIRAAST